jgi:hypothetical protein
VGTRTPPPTTAAELLASLAADPVHRAASAQRERAQAARAAEYAGEEALIRGEARALGYDIESVWDFVNNAPHPVLERRFTGPYTRAYPMLLRHLQVAHHPRVREGVIRALTVRDGGQAVWRALLQAFERETDPALRWVLANALKVAMPYRQRARIPAIAAVLEGTTAARNAAEGNPPDA